MTDEEKLCKVLDEFGIEYEELAGVNSHFIQFKKGMRKVEGYLGHFCEFVFDTNGNFKCVIIED